MRLRSPFLLTSLLLSVAAAAFPACGDDTPSPAPQASAGQAQGGSGGQPASGQGGAPAGQAGAPSAGQAGSAGSKVDPFSLPPTCTSQQTWPDDKVGNEMNPGEPCLACHASQTDKKPPTLTIAGTVYPTGHEPDRCYGVEGAGDIQVIVTDVNGKEFTMKVGPSGNFAGIFPDLVFPCDARVVSPTGQRIMGIQQGTGDCNSCHTQQGAKGAPGRIVVP